MAKYINPNMIDASLSYLQTNAAKVTIATAQPTTYAEGLTTYAIGTLACASGNFTSKRGHLRTEDNLRPGDDHGRHDRNSKSYRVSGNRRKRNPAVRGHLRTDCGYRIGNGDHQRVGRGRNRHHHIG